MEACPDDEPLADYLNVLAEVEIYTSFGIYYDTWDVACKGELFVRRHSDDQGSSH